MFDALCLKDLKNKKRVRYIGLPNVTIDNTFAGLYLKAGIMRSNTNRGKPKA